jgi:hypothetical protein
MAQKLPKLGMGSIKIGRVIHSGRPAMYGWVDYECGRIAFGHGVGQLYLDAGYRVGSAQDIAQVRIAYAKEAEPLGSVPQPAGLKNKVQTAVKAVVGEQPTLLMDKLGERLAFERSGTRLYEVLLAKHNATRLAR